MGCVASDVIFLSVSWILVNALSYFSCTFVNVLSCVHVSVNCKNTILCGGNKEYVSSYGLRRENTNERHKSI